MLKRINFSKTIAVSLFLLFLCGFNNIQARVFYVDDDATGANDGSSWKDAFNNLQYALYAAFYNDEIRVAQGIYTPNDGFLPDADTEESLGDRESSFRLYDDITIRGGYAGIGADNPDARDYKLYKTTLSGDLDRNDYDFDDPNYFQDETRMEDNCWHVITCKSNAVLDGFFIIGGRANDTELESRNRRIGGAIYNIGGLTIMNCTFAGNYAIEDGGAIFNYNSSLCLKDCIFTKNYSECGGGIFNVAYSAIDGWNGIYPHTLPSLDDKLYINIELENCKFSDNTASSKGGGIFSQEYSGISAIYDDNNIDMSFNVTNCSFIDNAAESGGAIYFGGDTQFITNGLFMSNSADNGGGIYLSDGEQFIKNSLFISNSANSGGGVFSGHSIGTLYISNCTSVWDLAEEGAFVYSPYNCSLDNCIVWYSDNPIVVPTGTGRNGNPINAINYSNIQGGWTTGTHNINEDPLFLDPLGPDNIPGTGDEDLRLSHISPCVDTGNPSYIPDPNEKDLDGNPRVFVDNIDMGAYEFQGDIYVDYNAPYENEFIEEGTAKRPFNTIQEAIDIAKDKYTVNVLPGDYNNINFKGKAITVAGFGGAATIEANGDAVTFHSGEDSNSVLKNFIIKNSDLAISLNYGSSPTIQNITFVDNIFGIAAYEDSNPDVRNCIFYNNSDGDIFGCQPWYSCFEGGTMDRYNFYADPLFVDIAIGDFHLKSEGWRWNQAGNSWTWDEVTSPCLDAGDPLISLGDEPLSISRDPNNLYGLNQRINIGAYGGTPQASMPPLGWKALNYEY